MMFKNKLKKKIRSILLKINPVGAYLPEDSNTDEYNFEEDMILSAIPECHTEQQFFYRVYTIFSKQFGVQESEMRIENLKNVSKQIWEILDKEKA